MRKLAGLPCILLFFLCVSCSNRAGKDEVISVSDEDPDMVAAIAKARSLLPQFWQTYEHPQHGETNFCLKVKINDKDLVEHFWMVDIQKKDQQIFGTINNDAEAVHNVKNGDRIEIPEENISDWLYTLNGKMVGNFTLRPLFKKMPPGEVEQMKKTLAEP